MRHRLAVGTDRYRRLILCLIAVIALTACAPGTATSSPPQTVNVAKESIDHAVEQPARRAAAIDSASGSTILLEDDVWHGGFRQPDGSLYGGRSAVWLAGANSAGSAIETTFRVDGRPIGTVEVIIAGMDAPGGRAPLAIQINDTEVYRGPALTRDSAIPLPEGNWAEATYTFDAGVLQPGINRITIRNTAPSDAAEPPAFGIDYVEIIYESQAP